MGDTASEAAPAYAAGLVLVAELAYWGLEPLAAREDHGALALRGLAILATAVGAGVLGLGLAVVADVDVAGGLAVEAAGLAAATLAVALVVRLARARLR